MKKLIIGTIIVIVLLVLFLANFIGLFGFLNPFLNNLFVGEPDKSCNVDSDCKYFLKATSCRCSCGDVVNKNWDKEAFCPFRENIVCDVCSSPIQEKIKCVDNECKVV